MYIYVIAIYLFFPNAESCTSVATSVSYSVQFSLAPPPPSIRAADACVTIDAFIIILYTLSFSRSRTLYTIIIIYTVHVCIMSVSPRSRRRVITESVVRGGGRKNPTE